MVLGNLFHPQNKQGAQYSPTKNAMKGLQTAGGNKFVMSDTPGEQTIHLSNSHNKGTAIEVGFQGDGSITIKSNGPVTVLSPTISLEAGDKGEIIMHAKNITLTAEEEVKVKSVSKNIDLQAQMNITVHATKNMQLTAKTKIVATTNGLAISGGSQVDSKAGKVEVNS